MKRLMIILSLTLTTQLYCPPAPKVEGAHDETISHSDTTQDANKATANAEHMAENTQSKAPDAPTTSPTTAPKTSGSTAPGSVSLSESFQEDSTPTPTVTTIDHPTKGGWFTPTKKSSTTITDHGDGTHSITSKEEVKAWFTSKKTSITTEKFDTSAIENDLNSLKQSGIDSKNIDAIKNKITKSGKKTSKLITNPDGTEQFTSHQPDGTTIEITPSLNDSLQIVTRDQQGTILKTETQKDPTIINGVDHSTYGDKYSSDQIQSPMLESSTPQVILNENNQVIRLKYNDSGKVIEKKNQTTKEVEKITYQSDGTSTGITTDAQGVVTKTISYDKDEQVITPKLFA